MSLCRIALRRACVMALKGHTLAGDNVLDSEIGAVDVDESGNLAVVNQGRFIAVYTDRAEAMSPGGRMLFENGSTLLRIEFGITEQMTIEEEDPDNPGEMIRSVVAGVPFTSRAAEDYLDLLGRQVMSALSHPDREAANVFRGLFHSISKIDRQRESDSKGQRVAAQQIALTGELLPDPITLEDAPDNGPFARSLALMNSGTGDDIRMAAMMLVELQPGGEAWRKQQEWLGLTQDELLAVGLGPLEGDVDRETPVMSEGTVDIPGHGQTPLSGG